MTDEDGEEEYFVEEILCIRTRRGRREAFVKWTGWVVPKWTDVDNVRDVEALDDWEARWGPINTNNGPLE
jgi:hypothetical protein